MRYKELQTPENAKFQIRINHFSYEPTIAQIVSRQHKLD